ncbi:uncharacterized protein [Haliotis asinina]|uniref:uncharacterized protein n=1 Tax=Haliotis asinina TaxID=109174 RepID=UPI003531DED2
MAQATTSKFDFKMEKRQHSGSLSSRSSEDFSETSFDGETESLIGSATHQLVLYAMTKGHTIHSVTHMPPHQLSEFLRDFYGKVRTKLEEGPVRSTVSLKDIRLGLQKYFMKETGLDIVKDKSFENANACYEMAVRMGPRKCHRLRIEMDDLRKIYFSDAMKTDNPETLQNKVFFDVNLYIVNRGKDCMRAMTKNDFVVSTEVDGRKSVWLKYHPKFNIKEMGGYGDVDHTGTRLGEKMLERPGDPRCPVASFLRYLTHLHPMTEAFWQRPKRSVSQSDYVWFDNTPLGNSTLSKIMQRISISAGVKENYTNHSIRPSYIPLIETICTDALNIERTVRVPSVLSQEDSFADDNSLGDSSSLDSESPDDDPVDESVVGLRSAKMKVLELIRGLLVKDIKKFADWLKTVRVEYHQGELIVLCSPVDQEDVAVEGMNGQGGDNSQSKVSDQEMTSIKEKFKQNGPGKFSSASLDSPMQKKTEKSARSDKQDSLSFMQGISIKQVEFDSVGGTHCSASDISPLKVTIPSTDALLVSGLSENMQLLLHKKSSKEHQPVQEKLPDRIFYSENDMDVAEIAALLGACDSLKKNPEKSESTVAEISKALPHAGTRSPNLKADSMPEMRSGAVNIQSTTSFGGENKLITIGDNKQSSLKPTSPALKRQARVECAEPACDEPLKKRLCSSASVPTGADHGMAYPNSTNIPKPPLQFRPASLDSSPLMKKKRVRFGSGVQTITVKAEPVS